MERDGPFLDYEHQEQNGMESGWNDWKKNERERNELAGGPRSRTERFQKVGTCPALVFSKNVNRN